jgi:hypothetical protein
MEITNTEMLTAVIENLSNTVKNRLLDLQGSYTWTFSPWYRIGPILTGQESILTREDGTDTLSRKVGKELPHDVE